MGDPWNLYLIRDGDFLKVGISRCARKRLVTLQTGNPRTLVIERVLRSDQGSVIDAEQAILRALRSYRVRGEWFTSNIMEIIGDNFPSFARRGVEWRRAAYRAERCIVTERKAWRRRVREAMKAAPEQVCDEQF